MNRAILMLGLSLLAAITGCGGGSSPSSQGPPASVTIITQSFPNGTVGVPYSQTIQASGGVGPFLWSVSAGALPHNLSLGISATNSVSISGTPDRPQTAVMFTLMVTDATGHSASHSYNSTIVTATGSQASVVIRPSMAAVGVGQTQTFYATVLNDQSGDGVSWATSGCSGDASLCGSISDSSVGNAIFTAATKQSQPALSIVVTATSIADRTKSASAVVTFATADINLSSPTDFPAGNAPVGVAVADFNGDGKLDLAVADEGNPPGDSGGVSILLGKGDGTFQAAVSFAAGKNPASIAVGDFNKDGKADLVLATLGDRPSGGNGSLSVLLGNGDGTFQPPVTLNAGENPFMLAVGDFNGDGNSDIAAADFGSVTPGDAGGVNILLGNGNGTFQSAVQIAAGTNPVGLVARDFNGDGILDLAVADNLSLSSSDHGAVSILLGNGDGTFRMSGSFDFPQYPTSITAGVLNSAGKEDLVVSSFVSIFGLAKGIVNVFSGDGAGGMLPAWSLINGATTGSAGSLFPLSAAIGDFDGDGIQDVAEIVGASVSILRGNGGGTVEGSIDFPAGSGPFALATGDFNGDGKLDVVVADMSGNSVNVLLNTRP